MEAGKLRHRITIEESTTVANNYGEPVETWATFAEVNASREDLSGRELYSAQQVHADVTTSFGLRYLTGVTASMRIVSDGLTYNIRSVSDPDGRKRELAIIAARVG
jgi:SPP1 family predicted phage head-tail adaptor